MAAELPKIVSVDDHVVEPAHLFERWLPAKYREAGPHVERRGIGVMRHIGGGVYEQSFDESGPKAERAAALAMKMRPMVKSTWSSSDAP